MPSFFRSLSQRFRSPKPPRNVQTNAEQQKPTTSKVHQSPPPEINTRKEALCKVLLLDGTDLSIVISRKALADDVYRQVYQRLDLEERDYFGLQFTDHYHVSHWLDPLKPIKKQVPIGPPYTFRFRVKFYSSEPNKLREELTRYQFFLQLKQDIQLGKLECGKDLAIELAALALQSEFGDYNPREHTVLFVSEFRFHPQQDELMEVAILENYKECRGQTPAEAEMNYLNKAKWIELYGVDQHRVEGKDGNEYKLGLTPTGMLVFDGPQKIGLFLWEKIQRLDFRNKKLTLVVEEDAEKVIQLHTFVFELTSHKACKHLWKCAIEHHTFFRLKFHRPPKRARDQFFRLGSTFKHRGRTEYENVHREEQKAAAHRRANSAFQRRPSQRYLPRQSHIRQKVLLQEKPPDTSDALAKETTVIPATPASNVSSSVINASAPSKPADKVAAAEARLDSLIFAPVPTAVTTLSESPISGRKNGQRQTPTAQIAPESSFPSTKVLAETNNGLPKEHVTKIEISDKPYVAVKQSVPQQDLYKPTIQANPLATTIPVTLIPSNVTAPAVKCENSVSENLQPLSSATSVADNHPLDSDNASFTNTQGTNISEREKKAETPQPAVPSKIPTITPIPSKKVPSKSQLPTRISRSNIPITAPKSSAVVGSTVTNIPVHTSRIH